MKNKIDSESGKKKKKNFVLLSLDDDKAKSVADTVSNPTCKKILDFLADCDGTESEISEKLSLPISTVHYNLKKLVSARLVDIDNYHLSEKGKEVKHYSLANKYIVIAPKGADKESFLEAVKNILPVGLLGVVGTFFASKFSGGFLNSSESFSVAAKSSFVVEPEADFARNSLYDEVAPRSAEFSSTIWDVFYSFSGWEWFLFGFTFAIFSIWLSRKITGKFFKKSS